MTHHVGPHGGHFSSNAERKEASHPVSREYVRIQSVMEADVRELDIQCLPTTPTPHFCALIGSLFHVLTHHQHQCTEMLFFLLLPLAKRLLLISFPAQSVAIIPMSLATHKHTL